MFLEPFARESGYLASFSERQNILGINENHPLTSQKMKTDPDTLESVSLPQFLD